MPTKTKIIEVVIALLIAVGVLAIGAKLSQMDSFVRISDEAPLELSLDLIKIDSCIGSRYSDTLFCSLFLKDKAGIPYATELNLNTDDITNLNLYKQDIEFTVLKVTQGKNKNIHCINKLTLSTYYNLINYDEQYLLTQDVLSCPELKTKKEYIAERSRPIASIFYPWVSRITDEYKKLKQDPWEDKK